MPEKTESRKRALAGFAIRLVCFTLILSAVLVYGSYVLTPKQEYGICPMTNLYMQPAGTVDVLVVGTSLAYAGINTNVLWREYGMATYDLCGAEQPFWETYYLLREALTLQHPKLIILETKAACYNKNYSSRARTIQHTFGILNPIHRIEAIYGCQEDPREALGFVLAYPQIHNRYSEVSWEDFSWPPTNQGRGSSWKGFIEDDLVDPHVRPFGYVTVPQVLSRRSQEYVRKMIALAKSEDIPILLAVFPNPHYDTDAAFLDSLWTIANENKVPYVDYNDQFFHIVDYATDFADWEHLNVRGSIKMSLRLGKDINDYYHLPDHRGDPAYASYDVCADIWYKKLDSFISAPQ